MAAGDVPVGVAVSPDGQSVYVANGGDNVSQYDVGAGGALAAKSPATVAAGDPVRGRGEPRRAERLRRTSDNVSQYDVGAGGALAPKSPATVAAGDTPLGVAVSPLARVPTSKAQCKKGGWKQFGLKNQGQCIRFVKHGPKTSPPDRRITPLRQRPPLIRHQSRSGAR